MSVILRCEGAKRPSLEGWRACILSSGVSAAHCLSHGHPMNLREAAWLAQQRRRWMLPDPSRWLRPDHAQWLRPEKAWHPPSGLYELKYSPDQPRVPAGNPEGGQWTDAGGASGGGQRTSEDGSANTKPRLFVAAGLPRIPRQRPPSSSERTAIAKAAAIWLAENGIAASEAIAKNSWLYHAIPYIRSYLDAPKPLEELQQDVSTPKIGYDVHHIVEQSSAEAAGYQRRMIDAPDNLVRIPRLKHWEINAWYQRENASYGDVSPREYLRGKDWDERRRAGLDALTRYGVLKP